MSATPQTKSDHSFLNSKEWVDTAIQISGSKHGGCFESTYPMTSHIIRFYRDSFLAACKTQRVAVCKPMSSTQFQAMLCAGKISGTGERELKKHISAHLGKGFCPTRRSIDMLAEGHCGVHYGSIELTYIDDKIEVYLQRYLTSKSITLSEVKGVQVVVGGDHGDIAFQFGVSVSVHLTNDQIIVS